MNDFQAKLLAQAFSKLLPNVSDGTVAFVTFLDGHTIENLCKTTAFDIQEWKISGVVDAANEQQRLISADQAVELREEKRVATFF